MLKGKHQWDSNVQTVQAPSPHTWICQYLSPLCPAGHHSFTQSYTCSAKTTTGAIIKDSKQIALLRLHITVQHIHHVLHSPTTSFIIRAITLCINSSLASFELHAIITIQRIVMHYTLLKGGSDDDDDEEEEEEEDDDKR